MNIWIGELLHIVHEVLGCPDMLHEQSIMLLIAFFTLMMTFRFSVGVAGISHFSGFGVLMALGVGLLTLLGTAAAVAAFVFPHVPHAPWVSWTLMLLPIAVTFLVGIPVQCLLLRAGYVPVGLAFGAALITTMLVLMGTNALMGSFNAGKAESDLLRAHKTATEDFINQ
ncbi:MAG: hypothetical protein K8T26_15365 [Lentisphaerae bacterium]|nr:hypothetical protein [Lentisphaerota bacterium]